MMTFDAVDIFTLQSMAPSARARRYLSHTERFEDGLHLLRISLSTQVLFERNLLANKEIKQSRPPIRQALSTCLEGHHRKGRNVRKHNVKLLRILHRRHLKKTLENDF